MNLTSILLATWGWNAGLVLLLLVVVVLYGLWTRSRRRPGQAGIFVAACLVVGLALSSPLNVLAEGCLFSAHMLQHLLLLVVVPALVLRSLPRTMRGPAWTRQRSAPLGGWIAGIGAMSLWHVPALCDAASSSTAVHLAQAVSLLAMGTAFWWPIFAPHKQDRISPWAGVGYLFTACLACTAMGILLTLTPIEVCPVFRAPADRFSLLPVIRETWGVSAARDRAVGGLLMWVPLCAVYVGAILLELNRWYHPDPAGTAETA